MSKIATVLPHRVFGAKSNQPAAPDARGTAWYRRRPVGVYQRSIAIGLMLSLGAVVLSACGGGQSASTTQNSLQKQRAAQGQKTKQKESLNGTVVGMHYVQMATSVDPLRSQLTAALSAGQALPEPQAKTVVAELEQFDAALPKLSVPGDLRLTLKDLRTADEGLVQALTAIEGATTVTPSQVAAARTALQRQRAAATTMSTALGLSTSKH
jgi:hypothetical protein